MTPNFYAVAQCRARGGLNRYVAAVRLPRFTDHHGAVAALRHHGERPFPDTLRVIEAPNARTAKAWYIERAHNLPEDRP